MNTMTRPFSAYSPPGATLAAVVNPQVSVVVVAYRTGPSLFDCVRTVLDQSRVDELVLVDNGSTEEDGASLRRLAEGDARIKLFQGHGNIGFAKGANAGASAARGRWLIFLNPDAFLNGRAVEALVETAKKGRGPCVVGARIMNADGTEQQGGRRSEITPFTALLTFLHLTRTRSLSRYEIHREHDNLPTGAMETAAVSGACFCVSRADFASLRGFDGGYFLHVEDVDLCWRARRAGGQVLFEPRAEIVHLGHTSRVSPLYVEFHKGVGIARYFRKRADKKRRRVVAYLLSPFIIVAALGRAVVQRRRPNP